MSQPTISDQIKLLEEYFERSLFERKSRGLHLTKEGRLALSYAEKIFEMAQEATYRIKNKIELPKRSVDIGITHFMTHYFLYDTILPLFQLNDITVNIKESERHLLLADLDEGHLDMIITDNKESIPGNMKAYRLGVNKTFAVGHRKFMNYKREFPKGLENIPFFNYTSDSFLKYEIEIFFSKYGIIPKIIGEGDDIDLFGLITESGHAFTIVPEAAKNRLCQKKDIVVLGELEELQTSVWAILKNNYKGPALKIVQN